MLKHQIKHDYKSFSYTTQLTYVKWLICSNNNFLYLQLFFLSLVGLQGFNNIEPVNTH